MSARVRFEIQPVVRVSVVGSRARNADTLRIPDDRGVVQGLMQWMHEQAIYPAARGGTMGGGMYVALHTPEDAERIRAWLRSQDCFPAEPCRHCGRMTHPWNNTDRIPQELLDSELVEAGLRCPVCWSGS